VRGYAIAACLIAAGIVVGINLLVRRAGGAPELYSVTHTGGRARGLAMLGRHQVACDGEHGDPRALVRAAAERQRISPRLALAVAEVESSLIHTKLSATGAMGLMQLMPGTAAELAVSDPFDPAQNADGGTRYLAQLLRVYRGDVRRALAAYNAGMGRIPVRGPYAPPTETVGYVARVLRKAGRVVPPGEVSVTGRRHAAWLPAEPDLLRPPAVLHEPLPRRRAARPLGPMPE
jgi:Transglycosylase SLT domain